MWQVVESLQPEMTEDPVSEAPQAASSAVEETVDLPHEETPAIDSASDVPADLPQGTDDGELSIIREPEHVAQEVRPDLAPSSFIQAFGL